MPRTTQQQRQDLRRFIPRDQQSAALLAGDERLGQQTADDVAAGAPFFLGDGVNLGDGLGVEADGEQVSGHDGSVAR